MTTSPNDDVRELLDFLDKKGLNLGEITRVQQAIDMQTGARMQTDRFKTLVTILPVVIAFATTVYWASKAESKAEEADRKAITAQAIADKAFEMAMAEGRTNAEQNSDIKNLKEGIARVEARTGEIYTVVLDIRNKGR